MKIWIIDHQPIVRAALRRMVGIIIPAAIVIDFDQLSRMREVGCVGGPPDLIISDLRLPDAYGISAVREIKAQFEEAVLMIFSSVEGSHHMELCHEFGASYYFEKTIGIDDLYVKLVECANLLGCDSSLHAVPIKFSRRQRELLPLLMRGKTNREISEALSISEHTVKVHLYRLYQRLNVKSRLEAVYKFSNYIY